MTLTANVKKDIETFAEHMCPPAFVSSTMTREVTDKKRKLESYIYTLWNKHRGNWHGAVVDDAHIWTVDERRRCKDSPPFQRVSTSRKGDAKATTRRRNCCSRVSMIHSFERGSNLGHSLSKFFWQQI